MGRLNVRSGDRGGSITASIDRLFGTSPLYGNEGDRLWGGLGDAIADYANRTIVLSYQIVWIAVQA
jgi:hypothetical protein